MKPNTRTTLPTPDDPPCEVCGNFEENCVCPICPVCGEVGNPACYLAAPTGHDLALTAEQWLAIARFDAAQAKEVWQTAERYVEWLEEQVNPRCQNCGEGCTELRRWKGMVVCPDCRRDLVLDKGPDPEDLPEDDWRVDR
jgi:hypothetical protein